jgi:hypothetical protein
MTPLDTVSLTVFTVMLAFGQVYFERVRNRDAPVDLDPEPTRSKTGDVLRLRRGGGPPQIALTGCDGSG